MIEDDEVSILEVAPGGPDNPKIRQDVFNDMPDVQRKNGSSDP